MVTSRRVQPWQVWWINFDPQVGREQAGLRPGIVVGNALACSLPNGLALVVPCTTRDRGLPVHPAVTLATDRASVAMCDQIKSISIDRLVRLHAIDVVPADQRPAISFALRQLVV